VLAKAFSEQVGRTLGARKPRESDKERPVWSLAEARRFGDHIGDDRLYPLWRLLLVTGWWSRIPGAGFGRSHRSSVEISATTCAAASMPALAAVMAREFGTGKTIVTPAELCRRRELNRPQ
jgi:hypothetical protein